MKTFNWSAIIAGLAKAWADYKANKPRPANSAPPITGAELLADLDELEAALPVIKAWVADHPGVLTAIDDLLDVLEAEGFTWAAKVRDGVDAAPSGLSTAATWLPRVIGFLSAIQPAAIGIPGGFSGARGHV